MRDFYKVLGTASTADDKRLKSAFRRRAKAFHPDLNPGDRCAEQRFKELTQAYEVLRSARTRASYDAFRAHRRRESRRRFAQSAALMVASFMLTMGSGYAVMVLHGGPLGAGWQVATSSPVRVTGTTTSAIARPVDSDTDAPAPVAPIAVASATPPPVGMRTPGTEIAKVLPTGKAPAVAPQGNAAKPGRQQQAMTDGNAPVVWANATSVQRHEPEPAPPLPTKVRNKLAAATQARQRNPATAERGELTLPEVGSTGEASWWSWPAADGSYMGLGATNR